MQSEHTVNPELLANYVPLNALPHDSRSGLAKKSALLTLAAGEYLFKIGQPLNFALFLVTGELQFEDTSGRRVGGIRHDDPAARHRLAQEYPGRVNAKCLSPVTCLSVDASLLDVLLTWDQAGACEVSEITSGQAVVTDDWMTTLLRMGIFQQLPASNLQAMFLRMEKIETTAGQIMVRQGEAGDYFYVVAEGRCQVLRERAGQAPLPLAELLPGACFGEEALISDGVRNATVAMLCPGVLMRLSSSDFRALLAEPSVRKLSFGEASGLIASGKAQWLDVRLQSEFQNQHLAESSNLPLYLLRLKLQMLDPQISYICVCDTGSRSAVAFFVLTQKGFTAYALDGGLPSDS